MLIYGLNYAPELTGVGKYTAEMAEWMAKQGHEVRVVTGLPYYPAWQIRDGYRKWFYSKESAAAGAGPSVYRCPLWVPSHQSGRNRVIHLSSFALSSLPMMMVQSFWKPDLVFTVEPTFFAAPVALLSAALSNTDSWLHIQDFEVDAAFKLELLPPGGLRQRLAKIFEAFFMQRFSKVSSITEKMVERASEQSRTRVDPVLFPNWGDVDEIVPSSAGSPNRFRRDLGLAEKVVVLYSGNMGGKQGLEVLGPLAEALKSDPRIHFLLCGDGGFRANLEQLVGRSPNVTMLPLQPRDQLNELLNAADIHLLPQRRGAADLAMPSKLIGMFLSGRPVVAIADEGTQVDLAVSGRGIVAPFENLQALQAAVRHLASEPALRTALGASARDYALLHLDKERVLRRFEQDVLALVTPAQKTEAKLAQSYRG